LNGVCVEEDKKKAVELFKQASELGNQRVQNLILNSTGSWRRKWKRIKKKTEGFERLKKAAEDGEVESIFNLG